MNPVPLIPNSELLPYFECRVCYEYSEPPCHTCPNGHYVCKNCLPALDKCPTCRGAKPRVRNLVMEGIAQHLNFPCKFADQGCQMLSLLAHKDAHEDTCIFKVYNCPHKNTYGCGWRGMIPELIQHMAGHPATVVERAGNGPWHITLTEGILSGRVLTTTFLLHFDDRAFVATVECILIVTRGRYLRPLSHYSVVVQHLGPKHEARDYAYKVATGNNAYRLTFEGDVTSIDVEREGLLQEDRCFHLPVKAVPHISDAHNNLPIEIQVLRKQ